MILMCHDIYVVVQGAAGWIYHLRAPVVASRQRNVCACGIDTLGVQCLCAGKWGWRGCLLLLVCLTVSVCACALVACVLVCLCAVPSLWLSICPLGALHMAADLFRVGNVRQRSQRHHLAKRGTYVI